MKSPEPQNLYIIGNGFDRHHELKTSYQSFSFYLKENYGEIYELLITYYGLPDLHPDSDPGDWELWSEFENALANLDFEQVLDDNAEYQANPAAEDFRDRDWHSYQVEMEGIVDNLTKKLCEAFRQFILDIEFPNLKPGLTLEFRPNSIFLNFNYTDTLEGYYGIPTNRILYLHGKAKCTSDTIILGHGIDPSKFKDVPPTPPEGLSDEDMERWEDSLSDQYEYSYEAARAEIKYYFVRSHKITRELIEKNIPFFESLHPIQNVFILGHSLADVDFPYFEKIATSVDKNLATWTVTYHKDEEREHHMQKLLELGVKESKVSLIKINQIILKTPTLFDAVEKEGNT